MIPDPKFSLGVSVTTLPTITWRSQLTGKIVNIGDRSKKSKQGKDVFDTHSYLVTDEDGVLHYFLEDELA
jgi:hypothetical protein